MSDSHFVLLEADTMLERLAGVYDTDHLRTNFYPEFTKHAGTQATPTSVVRMIELALGNFLRGQTPGEKLFWHQSSFVNGWIVALVPDETLAAETKKLWAETP